MLHPLFRLHRHLAMVLVVCSYTISQHLSGLKRLTRLILGSSRDAAYGGGIEHLPALRMLALPGISASGAALKSTTLKFLLTRGLNVRPSPLPPILHALCMPHMLAGRSVCNLGLMIRSGGSATMCMVCLQGRGVDPDKHLRLGVLPNLTSFCAHELLELTPAMLHDIISLQALRVRAWLCRLLPGTASCCDRVSDAPKLLRRCLRCHSATTLRPGIP